MSEGDAIYVLLLSGLFGLGCVDYLSGFAKSRIHMIADFACVFLLTMRHYGSVLHASIVALLFLAFRGTLAWKSQEDQKEERR